MNIIHVTGSMDPRSGGPCQGIRNLMPQWHKFGHSAEVVCLDDPNSPYLSNETIRIHALGKSRGSFGYHPALRPWLDKNLARFDAVILNGIWQYTGYALSKATRYAKAPPYFVFPHGMLDPWFQRAPERRFKAIRNWFYWKLIEQHVIRNAEAVLFTCAEEMRLAGDTFRPYQPKQQLNVGYGVAQPPQYHERMADAFVQKCPGLDGKPYFLFLSRIHPKKGVDLMIKAYSALYNSSGVHNQQSPKLVIAGPGMETAFGISMQKLAAKICPPDSIFWPGMLTGDAKWGALYRADAFVLTSHQENFGIAVVEALACGKPVLISNQINIWREIEKDNAGLVSPDTLEGAEQLFRRWKNLLPEDKALMNIAAKASYENRFNVALIGQYMHAVIENLAHVHSTRKSP